MAEFADFRSSMLGSRGSQVEQPRDNSRENSFCVMFRNLRRGSTLLRSAALSSSCSVTTPLFRHTRTFIRPIILIFSRPWNERTWREASPRSHKT